MTDFKRVKVLRVVTAPETVLWHLGKSLDALALQFDVCVAGQDVSQYRTRFPAVSWVDINIARQVNPLRDIRALLALCLLCYRFRPDIAHSVMPKAGLLTAIAAWIMQVPVRMHTFTGQVWETKSGVGRSFYKALDRFVVALNTVCLTDSPSQSRYLHEQGISWRRQALPVLGKGSLVGVDLLRFDPERILRFASESRASLGLDDAHFVIAFIARKTRDKGAFDTLRAFSRAREHSPDLRLLFIGPDESSGELERLRQQEPALFQGVVERGSVTNHEEFLLISDLLCLPSYREGFGSIVIDAAALRVPTVGSNIVGLVDSVQDGTTGLLFPAGDIAKIAELFMMLEKNRSIVKHMGQAARARVEAHFSSHVLSKALADFYQESIQSVRN